MKLKRILSVPIFSVLFVVGFVSYVTIFVFIEDCFGLNSSAGLKNAMIFTSLAFLFVFSFIVCVLTDPGGVPPGFLPDVEESLLPDQENMNTVSTFSSWGVWGRECLTFINLSQKKLILCKFAVNYGFLYFLRSVWCFSVTWFMFGVWLTKFGALWGSLCFRCYALWLLELL